MSVPSVIFLYHADGLLHFSFAPTLSLRSYAIASSIPRASHT